MGGEDAEWDGWAGGLDGGDGFVYGVEGGEGRSGIHGPVQVCYAGDLWVGEDGVLLRLAGVGGGFEGL